MFKIDLKKNGCSECVFYDIASMDPCDASDNECCMGIFKYLWFRYLVLRGKIK